jgi:hypothetical protein
LVEEHDPIRRGSEQPSPSRRASRTRTSVQDEGGFAIRVAAGFPQYTRWPSPTSSIPSA